MQAHVTFFYHPSRTEARQVACPYCGAAKSMNCVGFNGKLREANHRERVVQFLGTYGGHVGLNLIN